MKTTLTNHTPTPTQAQRTSMFDSMAPWYDAMNRRITLGLDLYWRARAIRVLIDGGKPQVLDAGTGTADLAIAAARRGAAQVVGVDLSPAMLALGQNKVARAGLGGQIVLVEGDAQQLPFPAGSFDAIVNGFVLRNLADMAAAFADMARVTRAGGRLVCLDLSYPRFAPWRAIARLHIDRIIPLLGRWLTTSAPAYRYLPTSIARFPPPETVINLLLRNGWQHTGTHYLFPGTAILYIATRRRVL